MPITFTEADQAAWYASLATMYGTAAALITSPSGDVLLVKPNYREHWSLPGGVLEDGEPPDVGCVREVLEELGLTIALGPLLTVAWIAPDGPRPKPMIAFIFDGGVLADASEIVLQESELDGFRFVPPSAVAEYLPPHMRARVDAALRARDTGSTVYLGSLMVAGVELAGGDDPDAEGYQRDRNHLEVGEAERDADDRQA